MGKRKRMEPTQEDEDKVLSAEKGLCYLQDTLHKIHNNHKTQIQSKDTKHKNRKQKTTKDFREITNRYIQNLGLGGGQRK